MIGFPDLATAVAFAITTQEELLRAMWPYSLLELAQCQRDTSTGYCGLRVRMGVTYGEVNVELNEVTHRYDYLGQTVNRAARLEAQGVGGGVVVEKGAMPDIPSLHKQAAVVPLGFRTLKGISDDVALVLLVPQVLSQRVKHIREVLSQRNANPLVPPEPESPPGSVLSRSTLSESNSTRAKSVHSDVHHRLESVTATTGFLLQNYSVQKGAAAAVADANAQLSTLLANLARSDGRLLNLCGTAALVAWNVVSSCTGHVEGALRFVTHMSTALPDGALRCGLCSGAVLTGYIGTREQRFVAAVGPCVQASMSSCFWGRNQGIPVVFATCDEGVSVALTGRGLAVPVGAINEDEDKFPLYSVDCSVLLDSFGSTEGRGLFVRNVLPDPRGAAGANAWA